MTRKNSPRGRNYAVSVGKLGEKQSPERRLINGLAVLSVVVIGITATGWWQLKMPRVIDWESEIAAFDAMDAGKSPPENSVLFVGSSSIRRWEGIKNDFPSFPIIRRGIRGAHIEDVTGYADSIVLPYEPRMILLYAGDNDLAFHRNPEQVLIDFKEFVSTVREELSGTKIGFISIKPSVARWPLIRKVRMANRLVQQYAESDPLLSYIDVFTPMLDSNGKLKEIYFSDDGLHLSRRGYRLWRDVIREQVPVLAEEDQ